MDEAAAAFPETTWLSTANVLVVDDDPVLRRLAKVMLEAAGFTVAIAATGHEGVAALTAGRFDVVVSDVDMPDGDGFELLRGVRAVDLDIPVILITGIPDVRAAARALEYGAFRYLLKPLEFESVVAAIRTAATTHAMSRVRRAAVAALGTPELVAADRAGLEVRFASALERMWMAFQPIVGADGRRLFGMEALLRTDEPSMPSPVHVLDAARKLGRLHEVGRRTRRLSAAAVEDALPRAFLFVNLHADDLFDDDLVSPDTMLVQSATRVVLEITERASLPSTPALQARIAALREVGFRFAIDDIGAGYSGLTTFAEVLPEVVKVDMALVRGVHQSEIRQRTIRSLCSLCHDVGCLVVAEGVEVEAERDCLLALGCDLLQGYLLGRPAREIAHWRHDQGDR